MIELNRFAVGAEIEISLWEKVLLLHHHHLPCLCEPPAFCPAILLG